MARKAAPKASKKSKKAKTPASSRTGGQTRKAAPRAKKSTTKVRAKTSAKKVKKKTARAASKPRTGTPKTRAKTARGSAVPKRTSKTTGRSKPTSSRREKPASATGGGARPAVTTPPRKRERPLSPQDIEQFRRMLLEKRTEILSDVSTLHDEALNKDRHDALGDVSSMPIHMADLGTDNYELEFTLGLIEGERAILQEIDEALARIQQGTYGLCLATGKPIGKARLKAKPWAKYCYEYTLAQEQNQGRRS